VGRHVLSVGAAADRARDRSEQIVLGGEPVLGRPRRLLQRSGARHHARLGCVERTGLQRVPRLHCSVRLRIRLAGTAGLAHPCRRGPRRATPARLPRDAAPSEGIRRQRQARTRACSALRRAVRDGGLALRHAAQPGARDPLRHRTLPFAAAAEHGHDPVAAERLLAGYVVGRDRR
jgi:hypothetical protein